MSFGGGRDTYTLEYLIKVTNQGGAGGIGQINSGIHQMDSSMKQATASAQQLRTAHERVIQAGQGVSKAAKGMTFGLIGITTAGAEMGGMLSMWAQVQDAVKEATERQTAALEEGGKESKEYRDATMELAKANRWASMTFRNLMLSIFDMMPFIILSINGLLKLRTALAAMKEAKAAQAALQAMGVATDASTKAVSANTVALTGNAATSRVFTAAKQQQAVSTIQSTGAFTNNTVALGTSTTATEAATVATTRLGRAMNILMTRVLPIVAILGTVAIAVKAWKENWGGVGTVFDRVGVAIGNIHPILKTTMEWIGKIGNAIDKLMSFDFAGARDALFGGGKQGELGKEFMFTEEQEKKIEEGQELMLDFRDAAVDSIVEISKAKKGEKNDWMKLVGIKGDEKDKMRDVLDTIEDSVGEMEQAGAKLHAMEAFNLFEKFGFEIPDDIKQDVMNTLDSDLRDILPGEDKFDELADIVQQNADKSWPEQRQAIASFFATNDPELLNMIKLVSPEMGEAIGALIGNMQAKFIELSEAQKAATAAGGVGTEAGADAWWDIMLPEADPEEIQKTAEAKKYGENITKGAIAGIVEGLKGVNINEVIGAFNDNIFIPLIENIQINTEKIGGFIFDSIKNSITTEFEKRKAAGKDNIGDVVSDFVTSIIKSPKTTPIGAAQTPQMENLVNVFVANMKIQWKKLQIAINNYIIANPWLSKLLKGDILGSIMEMGKALNANAGTVQKEIQPATIQDLGAELNTIFVEPIRQGINQTWGKVKEFVNNNPWLSMLMKGDIIGSLKSIIDIIGGGKLKGGTKKVMSNSEVLMSKHNNTLGDLIQTKIIDPTTKEMAKFKTWWDDIMADPIKRGWAAVWSGLMTAQEWARKQLEGLGGIFNQSAYGDTAQIIKTSSKQDTILDTPAGDKYIPEDYNPNEDPELQSQKQVDAFNMVHEASVRLQTQLANLSTQGSMSINLLAVNSSTASQGINNNFNVAYVGAGHLQTGIANLANEGGLSLALLAKVSSRQMNGFIKNLNKGYTTAGHLQTGLANLSNEGSSSLMQLAKASSRAMNGMINNFNKAITAAKKLKSALNSIPSGGNVAGAAHGMHRTLQADTTIFAHKGERVDIGPEHGGQTTAASRGSFGELNQNIQLRIDGNDIVNTMKLDKRVRSNVGRNRDRFL